MVIEACWNWGKLYEILEEIICVQEVGLANLWKTRLIADMHLLPHSHLKWLPGKDSKASWLL